MIYNGHQSTLLIITTGTVDSAKFYNSTLAKVLLDSEEPKKRDNSNFISTGGGLEFFIFLSLLLWF